MVDAIGELLTPPKKIDRLGDRIAADIRRLILSEKIGPGQKLPPERDLAATLGVSRVAVREALRILEQAGLLEISGSTRGGAVVTDNLHKPIAGSMADLHEKGQLTLHHFVEMRRANECFLIRLAADRVTASDLLHLAGINRRILDDLDKKSSFRENNMAFHLAIAEISDNPLGVLIVRSLFEILDRVRSYFPLSRAFMEDTFRRHEVILAALESRDPDRCTEAMRVDVEHTYRINDARTAE